VQRIPRGERLKGQLDQKRRDEDGAHPRNRAAQRRPGGVHEGAERGFDRFGSRRGRLVQCGGEGGSDHQYGAGGDEESSLHPEHPPEHQEADSPHAHLECDGARGERSPARRDDIGEQRLKGGALHVDAGVQHDQRGNQKKESKPGRERKERHADGGKDEPSKDDRQPAPAPRAGAIGCRARPRDQQEQQHVVDGHHAADCSALIPEGIANQRGDESAEQGARHPDKEPAQAYDQAEGVRYPGRNAVYGGRCQHRWLWDVQRNAPLIAIVFFDY
jgi:hypothetical protein